MAKKVKQKKGGMLKRKQQKRHKKQLAAGLLGTIQDGLSRTDFHWNESKPRL